MNQFLRKKIHCLNDLKKHLKGTNHPLYFHRNERCAMSWNEIVIHTSKEAEEAITYILNEFGANGVVIVDPDDLAKEKRAQYGELYELDATKYPQEGIYVKAYFIQNEQWDERLHK